MPWHLMVPETKLMQHNLPSHHKGVQEEVPGSDRSQDQISAQLPLLLFVFNNRIKASVSPVNRRIGLAKRDLKLWGRRAGAGGPCVIFLQ